MNEYVNVTMDGARLRAGAGWSVLDTANEYGICIPHLCHVTGLSELGGCRLCIVEHVREGRAKVTASCTLRVQEGMEIVTNSPKLRRLRRSIAELLVAEAPNSRAVQDMAVRCGVKSVRYAFRNEKCIQCGRCVRVCSEMWQADALGFAGRGRGRHVAYPFDVKPDFCKQCNTCVDLCPMTVTPCPGPMKKGQEYLCAKCESQTIMNQDTPDTCVWCDLGEGIHCTRQAQRQHA